MTQGLTCKIMQYPMNNDHDQTKEAFKSGGTHHHIQAVIFGVFRHDPWPMMLSAGLHEEALISTTTCGGEAIIEDVLVARVS